MGSGRAHTGSPPVLQIFIPPALTGILVQDKVPLAHPSGCFSGPPKALESCHSASPQPKPSTRPQPITRTSVLFAFVLCPGTSGKHPSQSLVPQPTLTCQQLRDTLVLKVHSIYLRLEWVLGTSRKSAPSVRSVWKGSLQLAGRWAPPRLATGAGKLCSQHLTPGHTPNWGEGSRRPQHQEFQMPP